VHAHDYPALVPAVEIAEMHQAALIYDSHEFWPGRPRRGRPEPFRRARTRRQEAMLARRADAVIMVSDHGADLMERALGLDQVHVIRNTFPTRPARELPQRPLGAVYAGRIAPWRDLETVFSARSWHSRDLALHLIGQVDNVVIPDWVQTHPMGTMEDVDSLLAEFGLALVTMTNRVINHRIALPNKLFQAIAVGVPVIAANAPQTAQVVVEHDLGALYEPGVPASFDSAVEEVLDRYPILVEHVRRAQPKLDWAVDADRLLGLYRDLEEKRRDRVAP
jgi:glycosyltransferase involved in cell wall biosynthesis